MDKCEFLKHGVEELSAVETFKQLEHIKMGS
jgi:hypothetical protein